MKKSHQSVTALVALGAALAMPLAFAQTETTTDASAQATTDASAQSTTAAAPAPAADSKKVTWADLDGDKDGKLTKTEAAPLDSLSEVFDKADANADGALTADEYKAYVAKIGGGSGKQG